MENEDIVIETKHVSKLYGLKQNEAIQLLKSGKKKDYVLKHTGVSVGLWDINLRIPKGKIFVIIGLSGSGKSTLVRCFNRLNVPTSGDVFFEGKNLKELSKKELLEFRRTKISMVFQSFGLMSHRDVLGNVEYGLEVKGVSKEEREKKAMEMISMVGLEGWENELCGSLSGGMCQRVGIARALASDPDVLLMDEPFSALDPLVRQKMQFELLQLQRKLKKTIVFITHDMDEAFKLGDYVAIMKDGEVIQVGTPEEMSAHPANEYVSTFIDSADKSQVLSVRNIMITPTAIILNTDTSERAIQVMKRNALSTVYVIDSDFGLAGILSIQDAIQAKKKQLSIQSLIQKDVLTTSPEAMVADIMEKAAQSRYPLAVIDEENRFVGLVTKASVLSSLL